MSTNRTPHPRPALAGFLLTVLGLVAGVLGFPGASAGASETTPLLEAERMSLPSSAGRPYTATGASGGGALLIWSAGTATGTLQVASASTAVAVTARGDQCGGAPKMAVTVDGARVATVAVPSTTWVTHQVPVRLAPGAHQVAISFTNDWRTKRCDRNLRLDVVAPSTAVNPLAGRRLHVASWTAAGAAADQRRSWDPAGAEDLDLLAATPTARWFGGWSGDIATAAAGYVSEASSAGALPVLVAYNIPGRDCGAYSSGGAGSADAYRTWIRGLASGIGSRRAVVVLEPDALALATCFGDPTRTAERYALLADAVRVLAARPHTTVYLDAGHAHWLSVDELARRLRLAGIEYARGVSLNVSNFGTTADQATYATALASRIPGIHAVVDTGRNGKGGDGTWCNPLGRAIGAFPTTAPAQPAVLDALLWVKTPGESDGTCNGGPSAGTFWAEYAIDLVRQAGH